MNEQDWFTWWDPFDLLSWCEDEEGRLSQRKLRLFSAACCRMIWPHLTDGLSRQAVEVAEWAADHEACREALQTIRRTAEEARRIAQPTTHEVEANREAVLAEHFARLAEHLAQEEFSYKYMAQDVSDTVIGIAMYTAIPAHLWRTGEGDAIAENAIEGIGDTERRLVREVFINPLDSLSVDPTWLRWNDGTIRRIAQGIYDERELPKGTLDGIRLTILADALLDAGCDNEQLLAHLRLERSPCARLLGRRSYTRQGVDASQIMQSCCRP